MHGVNLPLALTGQEYISHKVFTAMGLKSEDVLAHFAGPAFLMATLWEHTWLGRAHLARLVQGSVRFAD